MQVIHLFTLQLSPSYSSQLFHIIASLSCTYYTSLFFQSPKFCTGIFISNKLLIDFLLKTENPIRLINQLKPFLFLEKTFCCRMLFESIQYY